MSETNEEHELESCYRATPPISNERENSKWKCVPTDYSVAEIFAEESRQEVAQFINNILPELDDHRISTETQQQVYAFNSAEIKKLEAAARANSKQFYEHYINTHPDAKGLDFKFNGRAFVKKITQINYNLVFVHMLDCIIHRQSELMTQKAILESVKKSLGIYELNANIWNLPLKKFMKTKLNTRISSNGLALTISTSKTMADIRKAINTYYAKLQAVKKLKLEVVITPHEIIANGTSYKLSTVNSGTYQYRKIRLLVNGKRTWLGIDQLSAFLGI